MPDRTKYRFNGQVWGKGRLVLEIVRTYIEKHPEAGYSEVKQVFPDELQQKGLVQFSADGQCVVKRRGDVTDARRFHMNKEDQLVMKGEQVVVSREWNVHNIQNIIIRARELGFIIEAIK